MISDLFSIGQSGLRVHQAAMGVVSENIANASSDGYTRRSLSITESPVASATMVFYRSSTAFGGAEINGVIRNSDTYLDQAARQAATLAGRADTRATWFGHLQTALDDSTLGVGQTLTGMFSAVEKLAANPSDATLRMNVLFSFEQVNTAFKQTSGDLETVRTGIGTEAQSNIAALNTSLDLLASANVGLRRSVEGSAAHVQLLDQRDQALKEISSRLDAEISFGDNGVAHVEYDGQVLVDLGNAGAMTVTQNADGTLSFLANGASVTNPASGVLGGLAQSGEVTRDRISSLNALATQYVTDINNWHAAGQTAAGTPGGAMLSMTGDASTLQVLITNGADIAGATPGGAANGNLVAISAIRGAGSIEQNWTGIIAAHANLTSAALNEQTATTSRQQLAEQARADVSGVNLDREAAELIRLQQAYQASARVIQVARELTQTIFSIF